MEEKVRSGFVLGSSRDRLNTVTGRKVQPKPTLAPGKAFEDLGSTKYQLSQPAKQNGKRKVDVSGTRDHRAPPIQKRNFRALNGVEDLSDDELALTRENSQVPEDRAMVASKTKPGLGAGDHDIISSFGLKYHPEFLPKGKIPKFKKNKAKEDSKTASSSTNSRGHDRDSNVERSYDRPDVSKKQEDASPWSVTLNNDIGSPPRATSRIRPRPTSKTACLNAASSEEGDDTVETLPVEARRAKSKPKTRMITKSIKAAQSSIDGLTNVRIAKASSMAGSQKSAKPRCRPIDSATTQHSSPLTPRDFAQRNLKVGRNTSPTPKAAFPKLSPLSSPVARKENVPSFPDLSPLSSSAPQTVNPKLPRTTWPMDSLPPNLSPQIKRPPRSRKSPKLGSDSDERCERGDDNELAMQKNDEFLTRGGSRPFPMSTQMLESIARNPISTASNGSSKRSSLGGDDDQGPWKRKRGVDTSFDLPTELADMTFTQGAERRTIFTILLHKTPYRPKFTVDPSTLCPYCDEEFPTDPSPFLSTMLTRVRSLSYADPRPWNPLGLKAPLAAFITLCQRHRFELHQLPRAKSNGWPTRIDFSLLPRRIMALRAHLHAIVRDREKSVFWREIGRDIQVKGARMTMGVRGQFASFEKSQPGYYGEQGAIVINQTLYTLFPPATFDARLVAPLAPAEFIQRVLVPETAIALIRDDLKVDAEAALETLRRSSQYGVAMFPDADRDEDAGGFGEEIMRERARLRRQEIEEEDEGERRRELEEQLESEANAARWRRRDGRSGKSTTSQKGKEKEIGFSSARSASASEADEVVELTDTTSDASTKPISRWNPVRKAKPDPMASARPRSPSLLNNAKTPKRKSAQTVMMLCTSEDETPRALKTTIRPRRKLKTPVPDVAAPKKPSKALGMRPQRPYPLQGNSCPLTLAQGKGKQKSESTPWRFDMRQDASGSDVEVSDAQDHSRSINGSWKQYKLHQPDHFEWLLSEGN